MHDASIEFVSFYGMIPWMQTMRLIYVTSHRSLALAYLPVTVNRLPHLLKTFTKDTVFRVPYMVPIVLHCVSCLPNKAYDIPCVITDQGTRGQTEAITVNHLPYYL
ncbi:hypothetical protein POM88_021033 [Heracleum sosnowskyi]|uniref:Uncharacterized protein n=1 Tax=Heracleum sosnowskyi TaxID=360622 RepID=A0AAD8MTE9_9APIA|nr:hypothetical protein POM88_021033 [Heracleum sosnowskyi]